jgi:hypothetical protein
VVRWFDVVIESMFPEQGYAASDRSGWGENRKSDTVDYSKELENESCMALAPGDSEVFDDTGAVAGERSSASLATWRAETWQNSDAMTVVRLRTHPDYAHFAIRHDFAGGFDAAVAV